MSIIQSRDLQPGDMLLYSGQSWVGKLIRKLDGTDVTHAGVYLGQGQVGEALMVGNPGIQSNPFSLTDSNWIEVRRLADSGLDRKPIINVANAYIEDGNRYAYAEILLLAVILVTRKVDLEKSRLGAIAFWSMKKANNWIEKMLIGGREPMICSEFAFRCYDEADLAEDDPYTLTILSQAGQSVRRRFSRLRRRERIFGDRPENDLPTIHPDSLLAATLNEPAMLSAAAPTPQPVISDDELENMIADYLGEETTPNYGALPAASTEPISEQQLKQAAAELASNLSSTGRQLMGAALYCDAPVESRVVATFADFVTPGDLLKSPSLMTVGKLVP